MRSFIDAKAMAKSLRETLAGTGVNITHSLALECVAKQFGLADWNTLAARIERATSAQTPLQLPRDWRISLTTNQTLYRVGLDPAEPGVVLLESKLGRHGGVIYPPDAYASLMQSVAADDLKGRRVRLSAQLRVQDADAASIWLRVNDAHGNVLRFDNRFGRSENGAVYGTADWTTRHVVIDIPPEAQTLHYGFVLGGYGRLWGRGMKLEVVGHEIAITTGSSVVLPRPSNFDFAA